MKIFDILFGAFLALSIIGAIASVAYCIHDEVKRKRKKKQHEVKTYWSKELCENANKLIVKPLEIENLKVCCMGAKGLKAYAEEIATEMIIPKGEQHDSHTS